MKRFSLYFTIFILISGFVSVFISFYLFLKPFLPFVSYLLGRDKPTSYLIMLGNDTEMRANGGFAGSYAKITLSPSKSPSKTKWRNLYPNISLDFQDIYVPDGQVTDYTTPPLPIQQAFQHGTWQLANADWEPDFPTSAKSIRWFFVKGKEINPDILVIINLSTIKDLVSIVGQFTVPEYNSTITPENLYLFLQGKAEMGFFPGSTQKKDALYAVGHAFFKRVKSLSIFRKIVLAKIIYKDLTQKNIVLNSLNSDFQNLLSQRDYAGVFSSPSADSYALVEVNLGADKANAYVTRLTTHQISYPPQLSSLIQQTKPVIPSTDPESMQITPNFVSHKVFVRFYNSSPDASPNPPFHYGGIYVAYLRFYLPQNAQSIKIKRIDAISSLNQSLLESTSSGKISVLPSRQIGKDSIIIQPFFPTTPTPVIIPKYGFTEVGFFHTTSAGGESTVEISYEMPFFSSYSFTILKQNGMRTSPQEITINGHKSATDLDSNFTIVPK